MGPAPANTETRRTAVCIACHIARNQSTCSCGILTDLAAPDSLTYQPAQAHTTAGTRQTRQNRHVTVPGGWRRNSPNPIIAGYQNQVDIAQRIIKRCLLGRHDIAAELIHRELASGEPRRAFGLALALAGEGITAAAASRELAVAHGATWVPVVLDRATGTQVTPADNSDTPAGHAVRMLDAMHRYTTDDPTSVKPLTEVYELALHGESAIFIGFYQALVDYAVVAQRGDLKIDHHA